MNYLTKAMLCAAVLLCATDAAAIINTYTVGKYVYKIDINAGKPTGNATIVGLKPGYVPSGEITLPGSVTIEGTKYTVATLGDTYRESKWYDYTPVFADFPDITRVVIPSTYTDIAPREFVGCTGITEFHVNSSNKLYSDIDGILLERFDEKSSWGLFRMPAGRKKTRYTLPEEVYEILDFAFSDNTTITTIVLSGTQCFYGPLWAYGNRSIRTIDVSASTIYSSLDGMVTDYSYRIKACPPGIKLDRYVVPAAITDICDGAFCNTNIPEIVLHDNVRLYNSVFLGSKIKSLTFNGDILSDGENLCMYCSELESVTITGKHTAPVEFAKNIFRDCPKLTDITCGAAQVNLMSGCFRGCTSLRDFPFERIYRMDSDGHPTTEEGGQFAYSGIEKVNWPSTISTMPPGCFKGCANLSQVNLDPDGRGTLRTILREALMDCPAIESIDMARVNDIYYNAFLGTTGLRRMIFPDNPAGTIIDTGLGLFFNTDMKVYLCGNSFYWLLDSPFDSPEGCNAANAVFISSSLNGNLPHYWKKGYLPYLGSEIYLDDKPRGEIVEMFKVDISDSNVIRVTPNPEATGIDFVCTKTQHEYTADGLGARIFYTVDGVPMNTFYLRRDMVASAGDATVQPRGIAGVYTASGTYCGQSTATAPAGVLIVKYTDGSVEKMTKR